MEIMKESEAVKLGMSDIDIVLGIICGEIEADLERKTPNEKLHGNVEDFRFEPYHDVTVYEDGYEDWNYIGD